MTRPLILLDCDGVLADFVTPSLRVIHELGGPKLHHDDVPDYNLGLLLPEGEPRDTFWARVSEPGWCTELQPYVGAKQLVRELREIGDVVCVTSPMEDGRQWAWERTRWLVEHFGFDRDDVANMSGKHWVHADYFADDSPKHVERWVARQRALRGRGPTSGGCVIARSYNAKTSGGLPRRSFDRFVDWVRDDVRCPLPAEAPDAR